MKHILLLTLGCATLAAQVAGNANRTYQTSEGRAQVAAGLSDPQRAERQNPRAIIDAMAIQPAWTVGDVGTGVGFMLPYLSKAVGPVGRVIAEDIQQDFLDRARTKVQTENLTNIDLVLGTDRDPKLPSDTCERVLLLDVYHHFDYPETMLGHIRDALTRRGRLFIVEYYKRANAMPGGDALQHIRLDQDDLIHEVESGGFTMVMKHELVPGSQYIVAFEKKQ